MVHLLVVVAYNRDFINLFGLFREKKWWVLPDFFADFDYLEVFEHSWKCTFFVVVDNSR